MIKLVEKEVCLRKLRDEDCTSIAMLLNNKSIVDNLRDIVPFPYSIDDAINFITFVKYQIPQTNFAIEFQGHYCGMIGLNPQTDLYRQTAEIGYWLGEAYWNKGIATKAVRLITEYGFDKLKFARIHTGVFEYNSASMKVLEKNGFKKDGIFEKSVFKNGKLWDEHRYSKINEGYQSNK